ncbi:hypothetical protein [Deinococcus grandis]|nr:hypothetical protein [Deinococcus grandis]
MNRNVIWVILGTALVIVLGFSGYYFAVAVPAREQANLTLQQQKLAAQVAAQKAKAAAEQAELQAKQKELEIAQQKVQAEQDARNKRSVYLAACQVKAENVYWNYIKLNGEPVAGQPGVYNAPQYTWDEAKSQKQDKLDECFRLVDSGVNPDDLAGTVIPTTVPDASEISAPSVGSGEATSEIQEFVRQYLSSGESSDVNEAITLYAAEVSYFDQGVKPRNYVYKDKVGYFKRWPMRSYTLDSEVSTIYDTGSTRQVRFDYKYRVEKSDKILEGRAYTVLDLERGENGQYVITGERGKVY